MRLCCCRPVQICIQHLTSQKLHKDAIAKMLSGAAVGKGLNVKGKSAKKGVLSGFVPFVQISSNLSTTESFQFNDSSYG